MRTLWLAPLLVSLAACPQTPLPQTPTDAAAVDVAPEKVSDVVLRKAEVAAAIAAAVSSSPELVDPSEPVGVVVAEGRPWPQNMSSHCVSSASQANIAKTPNVQTPIKNVFRMR